VINFSYKGIDAPEYKLRLPPSVNNCYTVSRGRKIKTAKCREWRIDAAITMMFNKNITIAKPMRGNIGIAQHFVFKDKRRRDSSNFIKQLHDAIVDAGLIVDDSQFHLEITSKEIDKSATENYVLFKIWGIE
jgi:Holliday junction resolvase RusA-like endonuclease